MHMHAKTNEYQEQYPRFDATPKAVIAAIAYSLALQLTEDNHDAARELIMDEWGTLHQNRIIPQKPKSV